MNKPRLGRIRCATLAVRDTDISCDLYTAALDYRLIESGRIAETLACSWGTPKVADARYVLLGPQSGADTYLRFIECIHGDPEREPYKPYSTYGWNAIELVVEDCDAAAARLAAGGFELVGPPEDLGFSAGALRAAQLRGPSGEVLYLTRVNRPMDGFRLPQAACAIDRIFIAVLTGSSPEAGLRVYAERFANSSAGPFETAVPMIAGFQGMPSSHPYAIGTLELDPEYYLEFDGAPAHVGVRPRRAGFLPDGIAMITLEAPGMPLPADLPGSVRPGGALYGTMSTARIAGAFGEWLELVA